jgi:NAD(P)-dependent dehydrogenase (short-subunit alcohol dehydrogenase family)
MTAQLQGKVAIITGASQGLGLEIAGQFAISGASVVLCARNERLLEEALAHLAQKAPITGQIEAIAGDVSDPGDVARIVARTLSRFGTIDTLVNNAGVYGPMGAIEDVDWQQWVRTLEINIQGSVLMARAVLPAMKLRRRGKIIQLSGGGATSPMPRISAYAVSKAAIVRFAETLAEEVREFNIDVNSIAPGALNTKMLDEVLAAGPEKVGAEFFNRSAKQKACGGTGLERGSALAVFLASDASDGITGKLISAVWDNWEQWVEHLEELRASDAYTLRRIAGRDRGISWGDK